MTLTDFSVTDDAGNVRALRLVYIMAGLYVARANIELFEKREVHPVAVGIEHARRFRAVYCQSYATDETCII